VVARREFELQSDAGAVEPMESGTIDALSVALKRIPNQEDPNEVVVGEGAIGGRSGKLPSYLAVTWRSSPVISLLPVRAASVACSSSVQGRL